MTILRWSEKIFISLVASQAASKGSSEQGIDVSVGTRNDIQMHYQDENHAMEDQVTNKVENERREGRQRFKRCRSAEECTGEETARLCREDVSTR